MMGGGGRKYFATELLDKMRDNIIQVEAKEMESELDTNKTGKLLRRI